MGIRYTQPQQPVQIDLSNPIAKDCAGFYLSNNPNVSGGSPAKVISAYGVGNSFVRASSQYISVPLSKAITVTNTGATLIGIVNSTDATNGQSGFAISDGSSPYFGLFFRGDQSSKISAASWTGSVFRQWQTSTYASGVNYLIAITTDSSGNANVYINGVLQSGTQTNTGALPTTAFSKLIVGSSTSVGDFLSGACFMAAAFPRVLSNNEIISLSANPWQIFKAPPRRLWVVGAGGGAAALAGNAAAQASATGSLTTAIPIAAAALSISTSSAALSTAIPLSGAAASVASSNGSLTAQIRLSAAALAQAIASAGLSSGIILTENAVAQAAAQGTLSTLINLIANAQGSATASASLTAGSSGLSADAQAQATASASLTAQIRLSAAALAQAAASASLTAGSGGLSANALAVATAQGDLTVPIALTAAALAQAFSSGSLVTQIQLVAHASGQVSASGQLQGAALVIDSRYLATLPSRSFTATLPVRSFTAMLPSRSFTVSHKG